ncbi:hypothetical protein QYF61_019805 [Mycteria americana]|uniref:Uncharacterized protein n=1 Tax=Mycteria americana TaxID=33587 RepID=A0AAN7RL44_MYCAM|nr:hypothetical protein QYF61_019805 [Mycteria americana]
MLAGPDRLVILYMPCDGTQDDLLHQLPRHREYFICLFILVGIFSYSGRDFIPLVPALRFRVLRDVGREITIEN